LEVAQWLVENQGTDKEHPVWGYGDHVPGIGDERKVALPPGDKGAVLEVVRRGLVKSPSGRWDNSCSQLAVLGLPSAAKAGIKLPKRVWEQVETHFHGDTQADDGGIGYTGRSATGSMTCAGVASLLIARHHLGRDKKIPDAAVVKGLEWLAGNFT